MMLQLLLIILIILISIHQSSSNTSNTNIKTKDNNTTILIILILDISEVGVYPDIGTYPDIGIYPDIRVCPDVGVPHPFSSIRIPLFCWIHMVIPKHCDSDCLFLYFWISVDLMDFIWFLKTNAVEVNTLHWTCIRCIEIPLASQCNFSAISGESVQFVDFQCNFNKSIEVQYSPKSNKNHHI